VKGRKFNTKDVLESWKAFRNFKLFFRVVDAISSPFGYPYSATYFFGGVEGSISVVAIL
jgi:hypothetical protein